MPSHCHQEWDEHMCSPTFSLGYQTRKKKKKKKKIQNGKKGIPLSLFADDIILHIENPQVSTKKLWE